MADVSPRDRRADPLAPRVGKATAAQLEKLGLRTVEELLRHYPRRYGEVGTLTDLRSLRVGEHVTVMAQVARTTVRRMRNRPGALLETLVTDGVHTLSLTFFGKHPGALRTHEHKLRPGAVGAFSGEVRVYRGELQLTHPAYQIIGVDQDDEHAAMAEASRPMPFYPASSTFQSWKVHAAVQTVLRSTAPEELPDPIPEHLRERHRLVGLHQALQDVHEPMDAAQWRRGRRRLRYEEALVLQVALARRRAAAAARPATARPGRRGGLLDALDARLPFDLTPGQRAVGAEIAAELARPHPMQRLLQGEVGSGKTVVALRAMAQVIDSGGQAALLAPTEVLAQQHARTLRGLLGPLGEGGLLGGLADGAPSTQVTLLTGSLSTGARRAALLDIASGAAGIVVGTHALLGEAVRFADLGLVVVDEQHRFGVEQRDALRAKAGSGVHLLAMTATPIPRTVAMTVFGDLETSTLTEVPAGRSPVVTHVVPADNAAWLDRTWARVREEVDAGHRVYVVCPRISSTDPGAADGVDLVDTAQLAPDVLDDDDDELRSGDATTPDATQVHSAAPVRRPSGAAPQPRPPLRAVLDVAEELRARPELVGVGIGVLHGQMAPEEKDAAMDAFASGERPVLVTTTVIEVGVDVPEATTIVLLDADRFGLSQLHQLRGRVGRGTAPGLCLLVSSAPPGTPAATRLQTMVETTDGFRLAAVDLELRREGDVLGTRQSGGRSSLRLLRVVHDADLIAQARADAVELVAEDPDLERWPALREAIADQLADRAEFLDRV